MKLARPLAGVLVAVSMLACGGETELPVTPSPQPDQGAACRAGISDPVPVMFLAREAVPEELEGFDYFVRDWGSRQKCFKGTLLTSLNGTDLARYRVLVVDISHDQQLKPDDVAAIESFASAGKRIAVFAYPMRLADRTLISAPLGGLEGRLGGAQLALASGCGDWQFSDALKTPFALGGLSYRYENFGSAIFTVRASGPQRPLANAIFCPQDPGPVLLEVPGGVVAGFSLAYTLSLADDNVRSVGMKKMLVDVIELLAASAQLGS